MLLTSLSFPISAIELIPQIGAESTSGARVPEKGIVAGEQTAAYTAQKPLSAIPMTFEAWVNPSEYGGSGEMSAIFGNRVADNKKTKTFVYSLVDGYPALDFGTLYDGTNGSDIYRLTFSEQITPNTWTHVAFTVNTGELSASLYINGEFKETMDLTAEQVASYSAVVFTGDMKYTSVAGLFNWKNVAHPFKGQVASVAAYSDIRDADEIKSDYMDYLSPSKDDLLAAYVLDGTKRTQYDDLSTNKNHVSWGGFTYDEELSLPSDYDYSMFVVGDIQTLSKRAVNGLPALNNLYTWMNNNYASKKAAAIIGVGDVTDSNKDDEWKKAMAAFGKLGEGIIHMPILGNHDTAKGENVTLYKNYLTLEDVAYTEAHSNDVRAYYNLFEAGGNKFLFLGLTYGPTEEELTWAEGVIKDHPQYNVIISTHAYLNADGTLLADNGAPEIRERLVLPHSNVVLVLCGHMHDTNVRLFTEEHTAGGTTVQALFTNQQDFSNRMPYGVVTQLYFTNGGRTVNVANYIPDLDIYLGKDSVRSFELDLIEDRAKEIKNGIKADGFKVRMDGYTGLRALFSFDETVAQEMKQQNLRLESYGVFAASHYNFVNVYDSDDMALFEAARDAEAGGEKSPLVYIPVYKADGSGENKYTDYSKRQFCVSLTNITPDNALSDIYMAGYATWSDMKTGEEYTTVTTYAMPDGEKAINLYEVTLGLVKKGSINSENTDDACFWQILQKGALKTDDFNTENDATKKEYTLAEGEPFTYLDVDWYEYTGGKKDGYAFNPTGVSKSESGVVWSVLKYTDEEYVLILRNKDKSTYTNLAIPQSANGVNSSSEYKYYPPYDYRYGDTSDLVSGASICTYNPALSQADFEKIKTYVVDHGISVASSASFAGLTVIDTIVYPNGFSAESTYGNLMFAKSSALKNVIWCHEDEKGNPIEHMAEFANEDGTNDLTSLVDLRGFANISFQQLFNSSGAVENVAFGTAKLSRGTERMFINANNLKRAWSGLSMPNAGVIDLTGFSITELKAGMFACGSYIKTIMLPDTVTVIDSQKNNIFGTNKTFDIICSDSVEALVIAYAKAVTAAQKLKVNGTAVPLS